VEAAIIPSSLSRLRTRRAKKKKKTDRVKDSRPPPSPNQALSDYRDNATTSIGRKKGGGGKKKKKSARSFKGPHPAPLKKKRKKRRLSRAWRLDGSRGSGGGEEKRELSHLVECLVQCRGKKRDEALVVKTGGRIECEELERGKRGVRLTLSSIYFVEPGPSRKEKRRENRACGRRFLVAG